MKGRNEAWTARGKDGRGERAEEGLSEEGRVQGGKWSEGGEKTSMQVSRGGHRPVYASGGGIERRREGAREGRKLQERYPEEGTGQCTVYSQTIQQRGAWP